jgi:hypothetical protein
MAETSSLILSARGARSRRALGVYPGVDQLGTSGGTDFGPTLGLPPHYEKVVPPGHFAYRSGTNNVFVFLRAFYQDPANLAPPVALIEKARIYPLGHEADAKPMQFPDASGVPVDMLPASDASAFDQLKMLVDSQLEQLRATGCSSRSI